jgi:hypothetical protein
MTGLCKDCIKDPELVRFIAEERYQIGALASKEVDHDHALVCWLNLEPERALDMVLQILKNGQTDLRTAIAQAREFYWENYRQVKK